MPFDLDPPNVSIPFDLDPKESIPFDLDPYVSMTCVALMGDEVVTDGLRVRKLLPNVFLKWRK